MITRRSQNRNEQVWESVITTDVINILMTDNDHGIDNENKDVSLCLVLTDSAKLYFCFLLQNLQDNNHIWMEQWKPVCQILKMFDEFPSWINV